MTSTILNNFYDIFTNNKTPLGNSIQNTIDDNSENISSFQLKQGSDYLQNKSRQKINPNTSCKGNYKYNWKGDIIEGNTSMINTGMIGVTNTEKMNNESIKESEVFIDKYNQDISKYASKHKFLMNKTINYLSNIQNPYKNKNVKLSDGQIGYVTSKGIFKWYPNQTIYDQTSGKNGCPSGVINVKASSDNKFNTRNEIIYTDYPLIVGTPMRMGQSCGNEGSNVFVNSTKNDNIYKTYSGCYKKPNMGLDFQSDMGNNVTIESCKMRAIDNGSYGFAVSKGTSSKCYTISDMNSVYSNGISTKPNTSYVLIQSVPIPGTISSSKVGGLLLDGSIGIGNISNFSNSSSSDKTGYVNKVLFYSNPNYSGCDPNTGGLINSSDTTASYGANCMV